MIKTMSKKIYIFECEKCKEKERLEELYIGQFKNAVYACRNIGWAVTNDRKCYCEKCRQNNFQDKYSWEGQRKNNLYKICKRR